MVRGRQQGISPEACHSTAPGADLNSEPFFHVSAVVGKHRFILTSHLLQDPVEVNDGATVQLHIESVTKLSMKQVDLLKVEMK